MQTESKAEIARRQLGTALSLFIANDDPVSVHCLACGGAEIADALASSAGAKTFAQHALDLHPEMKKGELVAIKNKYWNALKHAQTRDGRLRSDDQLMGRFSDADNDHILFVGWHDYAEAVGSLPIEAQVFQVWYFANFPEKLVEEYPASDMVTQFPGIRSMSRNAKKQLLRRKIVWARRQRAAMSDSKTDRRKLILGEL